MLKIGVRLPRRFEDSGDYLADARAMESAGADSLWLDAEGYDPWLLLAGMATITGRIRLVVPVSSAELRAPQDLGGKAATLSRLSRGRMALAVATPAEGAAGVDAVLELARRSSSPVILETAADRRAGLADGVVDGSESPEQFRAAIAPVLRFREREKLAGAFELWATVTMPGDPETWRRLRREYEAAGATGIIVSADPRLLDLLRNGDEEEDRSDLRLAQG
jgi:alkanesulfonate monooxygenase SsuD/methylene tetrahydromethanopterin reductase-like flavin-dependent oxidoreductase (luciferase family)